MPVITSYIVILSLKLEKCKKFPAITTHLLSGNRNIFEKYMKFPTIMLDKLQEFSYNINIRQERIAVG